MTDAYKAKLDALCAAADTFSNRVAAHCDDHRVIGGVNLNPESDEWSEEAREAAARAKGKGVAERLAARKQQREAGRDRELTNLGKGPMATSGVNKRE